MKNRIITTLLATATIGMCLLISLATIKYFSTETIHTVVGTMTEINRYADFMEINISGEKTGFYGTRNFSEGDSCLIEINTHGTQIRIDDEILSVNPI